MLRIFRGVVRFFEWLRVWDDRLEAVWLRGSWSDFIKWWFACSAAIAAFVIGLVLVPGVVLLEINRLYQFLKLGSYPAAGAMYAGLGSFAVSLATVALTMAIISCPFFMMQIRHRGNR
jgi:hypothetical protein